MEALSSVELFTMRLACSVSRVALKNGKYPVVPLRIHCSTLGCLGTQFGNCGPNQLKSLCFPILFLSTLYCVLLYFIYFTLFFFVEWLVGS